MMMMIPKIAKPEQQEISYCCVQLYQQERTHDAGGAHNCAEIVGLEVEAELTIVRMDYIN